VQVLPECRHFEETGEETPSDTHGRAALLLVELPNAFQARSVKSDSGDAPPTITTAPVLETQATLRSAEDKEWTIEI
jgi:hypothetical protein